MVVTPIRTTHPRGHVVAAAAVGAALLLARPLLVRGVERPTLVLVAVFVTVGVVGAWWPIDRVAGRRTDGADAPAGGAITTWVALAGMGAFVVGRLVAGGTAAAPALLGYVALNTLAAVAEEALFRRLVYGWLSSFGPAVAVVGSAVAFAAVHVTVWGAWVLPLDLAAGLVLSWQRWASGRWSVPAATHAFANLVAVLP